MPKRWMTLSVEAETLYNLSATTPAIVLSHCALSDDDGVIAKRGDLKTKLFHVEMDKDVRWEGISVDDIDSMAIASEDFFPIINDYSVSIDYIIYFPDGSEPNFFGSIILPGTGNPQSKRVKAKVKDSGLSVGDQYNYIILFTIYPPMNLVMEPGSRSGPKMYGIDPKLQIK